MRASELIDLLKQKIIEHDDYEVMWDDDGELRSVETCDPHTDGPDPYFLIW
jgi:hypothetical protein